MGSFDSQEIAITEAEQRKLKRIAVRDFNAVFRQSQISIGWEGVRLYPCKEGEPFIAGDENSYLVCGYTIEREMYDAPTEASFRLSFCVRRFRWEDRSSSRREVKTETQQVLNVERHHWGDSFLAKSDSYPLTKEGFQSALSCIGVILAKNRADMAIKWRRRKQTR